MKLVFVTNFYNHHQSSLAFSLWKKTNGSFLFIETDKMTKERIDMGWKIEEYPDYVIRYEQYIRYKNKYQKIIDESDVVIMGSAPDNVLVTRLKKGRLTFRYSERMFKKACPKWQVPLRIVKNYFRFGRYKNEYLLCASAYTSGDFKLVRTFEGKCYKWGYFPVVQKYCLDELMGKKSLEKVGKQQGKNYISILWAGRLINWKHPDDVILAAELLKKKGYNFMLRIIGVGEMKCQLEDMINVLNLSDHVKLLGAMSPEEVRSYMEISDIYLFSSDFNEGWGAVLNEAMNSGCAVVASHAIGAVPFLIQDGKNGLIYNSGDIEHLVKQIIYLIEDEAFRVNLGRNAYNTIHSMWNSEVAAERFVTLAEALASNVDKQEMFNDGPCSVAEYLYNDWFEKGGI